MACRRAAAAIARRYTVSVFSDVLGVPQREGPVAHRMLSSGEGATKPRNVGVTGRTAFIFESYRHASSSTVENASSAEAFRHGTERFIRSDDKLDESPSTVWTNEADDLAAAVSDISGDRGGLELGQDETSNSTFWSLLRAPADGVVVLVDGIHSLTNLPWWLTIIGSTLAFRTALFPFTLTHIKKSAQFAASISLLPPMRPPKDSNVSFAEQYKVFTKRRLELGIPSPFWPFAGLLQAPLFLYWIVALRGMAMDHHPGFETGGVLWFTDLTAPLQGALGGLFPTLVAVTYFTNIQVSFRVIKPRNDVTAFFMKLYQWWLEAATVPLFIMGFYLPQGVFMYWLTNNCFNLAQSLALQHEGFRGTVGLPLLKDLEKMRDKQASESATMNPSDLETLSMDALLLSAVKHVTEDEEDEAIRLLEFLIDKYPEEAEVYNVHGMLHIKKKRWSDAIENYSLAIEKAKSDEPHITALMGAGISLYNQGRKNEAIDVMKPLLDFHVPDDPPLRQKYLRALITLASVLSQEGLKEEALSVLELAGKWDRSVEPYINELKQNLHSTYKSEV